MEEVGVEQPSDELAARRRFHGLLAPHLPAMRARARQLCRAHHDPDDVLQDALLRAFRTRSQLKDTACSRAWFLTILTRTFIDAVRHRRRRPDLVALAADQDVAETDADEPAVWQSISTEDVRAAVERLPDDVRDTYRMCALEGRDHAAVAREQRIAPATVGTRIFRARRRLRDLLIAMAQQQELLRAAAAQPREST